MGGGEGYFITILYFLKNKDLLVNFTRLKKKHSFIYLLTWDVLHRSPQQQQQLKRLGYQISVKLPYTGGNNGMDFSGPPNFYSSAAKGQHFRPLASSAGSVQLYEA